MLLPSGYEEVYPGVVRQLNPQPMEYDKKYILSPKLGYRTTATLRLGHLIQNLPIGRSWRVLDFGCGRGLFVDAMCHLCSTTKGFDVVEQKHPRVTSDLRLCTENHWDLVTFFDSLEHCEDINKTIDQLKTQYVCVSVPEMPEGGIPVNWPHFKPNEHLWYFTKYGLIWFLKFHGFTNILYAGNVEDCLRKPWSSTFPNIITVIAGKGPSLR